MLRRSNNGLDSSSTTATEETQFFNKERRKRTSCALTLCVGILVIAAAVTIILVAIFIANKEQVYATLLLDIGLVDADFAFWNPNDQVLYWVDRQLQDIYVYNPLDGPNNVRKIQINHSVGVVVPRMKYNDSVMLTSGDFVSSLNLTTEKEEILAYMHSNATDFSDGRCDPNGGLWAGASMEDGVPIGTLYRIDSLLNVTVMLENVTTPGGMAWSKDRKTFWFIDSKNSQVDAYSYNQETGEISFEQVAFNVPTSFGILSGMTIDTEDALWISVVGPATANGTGRVCRYDPYTGQLLESIILPVSMVTSCVFGGPDLQQLYITTRHKPGEPHSGGIYVAKHLSATGASPYLYAG